tara:strand:+ start:230 stop:943 length:714 start_codon:yes stop_codon:yes gene_type:complete
MKFVQDLFYRFTKVARNDLGEDFANSSSNVYHYMYSCMSEKLRSNKVDNYIIDKIILESAHLAAIYNVNSINLNRVPYDNQACDIYNFDITRDYGKNPLENLLNLSYKFNLKTNIDFELKTKKGFILHEFLHHIFGGHFNIYGERVVANCMNSLSILIEKDIDTSWKIFADIYKKSRYITSKKDSQTSNLIKRIDGKEMLIWKFINDNFDDFAEGKRITRCQLESFGKENYLFAEEL